VLNPMLAKSQHIGGLVWGIGLALHEATIMD
jgi:CO/xanthine dehydrogenase Mo-binding subunit